MKKLFSALLFWGLGLPVIAQTFSVKGLVKTPSGEGASFATVAVMSSKDSTLFKADIANENGGFKIDGLARGSYFMKITTVGFNTFTSPAFQLVDTDLEFHPFVLQSSSQQLQEVKVVASKPLVEVQHDKIVFNVDGSINATGSNGLELLRKAPGVQVDKDENIMVNGKAGVRIYIDGKISPMSGRDLASVLKSLNSADIEAIEVITNPSAKYDAAGDLGIINIRLKKNRKIGTNGNVSLGGNFGISPKYNTSLNLNHRDKKINVFGTYSYNQGAWHNQTLDNQILNGIAYNKVWNGIWRDTSNNVKIGADYFINSKHTLGISANGRISDHNGGGESQTLIGLASRPRPDSVTLDSRSNNPEINKNLNVNLNYRYADTTGRELNIDADYGVFDSRGVSFQPNKYTFHDGSMESIERNYVTRTPIDIIIRSFKIDYEQPFYKGKLGYGMKASDVKSDNTFDFFNQVDNVEIRDIDRSNNFTYTERVYAAYINYNRSLSKKWDFQAGLRMEHTKSLGHLTSYKHNDLDKVDTTYLNLFPSGTLSYKVSKDHSLNLNYSRRINRPSYQNLNPFEYRVDELVYSKGNPFLRPEYANNFKVTHIYKGKLTTSVGYYKTRFPVVGLRIPYDESRTYFIARNMSHSEGINLNMSLSTDITKWWNIYVSLNGYHNRWKGDFENGLRIDNSTTALNGNAQSTFKLKNNWSFEVSGWYNSPYRRIDYNSAMGMMDAGVQKKFWKDNASLKLTFSDVLNTARGGHHSEYAGVATDLRFKFEGRMLRVNFNYRFGSNEIKAARDRRAGSEDELNRIR